MSIFNSTPPADDPDADLDDPREYDKDEDGNLEPWYPGYQEDENEDDYDDEDEDELDDDDYLDDEEDEDEDL